MGVAMIRKPLRSILSAVLAAGLLLSAAGCSGPSRAEPKITEVALTTFLSDVRFDGLELSGPAGADLSKLTATGNHVSLWFSRKKVDDGEFEMNLGKQAIKGSWTLDRGAVSMTVKTVDGKAPAEGSPVGPFEFRPPRFVDDAFVIYTKTAPESSAAAPVLVVRNVGQDKFWEMSDGTKAKPSRTQLLMP